MRPPKYPDDATVRRVHRNRAIRWRGAEIYLNEALIRESVGLVEGEDGGWTVYYGPIALGLIDHRGNRLRRANKARGCGQPQPVTHNQKAPQPQQQQ